MHVIEEDMKLLDHSGEWEDTCHSGDLASGSTRALIMSGAMTCGGV